MTPTATSLATRKPGKLQRRLQSVRFKKRKKKQWLSTENQAVDKLLYFSYWCSSIILRAVGKGHSPCGAWSASGSKASPSKWSCTSWLLQPGHHLQLLRQRPRMMIDLLRTRIWVEQMPIPDQLENNSQNLFDICTLTEHSEKNNRFLNFQSPPTGQQHRTC